MEYAVPISQKGQITLPKAIRDALGITVDHKVLVVPGEKYAKISKAKDILDMAGSIKVPKGKNALKAREMMEKNYERF